MGQMQGKQIKDQSIDIAIGDKLNLENYTISLGLTAFSGKQLVNLEHLTQN
jgi:hypothetical protein